jgi:hypothetical protein
VRARRIITDPAHRNIALRAETFTAPLQLCIPQSCVCALMSCTVSQPFVTGEFWPKDALWSLAASQRPPLGDDDARGRDCSTAFGQRVTDAYRRGLCECCCMCMQCGVHRHSTQFHDPPSVYIRLRQLTGLSVTRRLLLHCVASPAQPSSPVDRGRHCCAPALVAPAHLVESRRTAIPRPSEKADFRSKLLPQS